MPPKPQQDQAAPKYQSPTGRPTRSPVLTPGYQRSQAGAFSTTAQGVVLPDTNHSLKAGPRGPSLPEDFHLRERITHLTINESRSGSCTPGVLPRTVNSWPTVPRRR